MYLPNFLEISGNTTNRKLLCIEHQAHDSETHLFKQKREMATALVPVR